MTSHIGIDSVAVAVVPKVNLLNRTSGMRCGGKLLHETGHEVSEREYRHSSTLSLTLALHGVLSTLRPSHCTPGNEPVPVA
jgi:hypothetical protein